MKLNFVTFITVGDKQG